MTRYVKIARSGESYDKIALPTEHVKLAGYLKFHYLG